MTNASGTPPTPAGWYKDPSGLPHLRWWDGTQWTEHLHDRSLEVYGATAKAVVGPDTPVYNFFIWFMAVSPALSIINLLSFDMGSYMKRSISATPTVPSASSITLSIFGWGLYLVSVLFAALDWRKLRRDGYVRPFHWAWAFLSAGVYVIGRSVVARRRSGRGIAPMWVWIAFAAASIVTSIVIVVAVIAAVMPSITAYGA